MPLVVQFKYGDCWQHEYVLGETIGWGGNDVGRPGRRRVVVSGAGESCPRCGSNGDFCVFLFLDRLTSVEPHSGLHDFTAVDEPFIILEA